MDGDLKKEQIDTLFVRVGLLQGGFWGGWVVQRGSHPFFEGCSTTFFFLPSWNNPAFHTLNLFYLFTHFRLSWMLMEVEPSARASCCLQPSSSLRPQLTCIKERASFLRYGRSDCNISSRSLVSITVCFCRLRTIFNLISPSQYSERAGPSAPHQPVHLRQHGDCARCVDGHEFQSEQRVGAY